MSLNANNSTENQHANEPHFTWYVNTILKTLLFYHNDILCYLSVMSFTQYKSCA